MSGLMLDSERITVLTRAVEQRDAELNRLRAEIGERAQRTECGFQVLWQRGDGLSEIWHTYDSSDAAVQDRLNRGFVVRRIYAGQEERRSP